MKGEPMKFYCKECNKKIDRRFVKPKAFEDGYRCKWCGSTVYKADKIDADLYKDFFGYLEKNNVDLSQYE